MRDERSGDLLGIAPMYLQTVALGPVVLATRLLPVGGGLAGTPLELPGVLAGVDDIRAVSRAVTAMHAGQHWSELPLTDSQGWFDPAWATSGTGGRVSFVEQQRSYACVVLRLASTWDDTRSGAQTQREGECPPEHEQIEEGGQAVASGTVGRAESTVPPSIVSSTFIGRGRPWSRAANATMTPLPHRRPVDSSMPCFRSWERSAWRPSSSSASTLRSSPHSWSCIRRAPAMCTRRDSTPPIGRSARSPSCTLR